MNLNIAKKIVFENLNKFKSFEYRGCRNQIEKFCGYIDKLYPSVFTIITDVGIVKSFTYTDIIIGNIIIY